jgi:hypothetical protein
MPNRVLWLLQFALLLIPGTTTAQTIAPTSTYKLHAHKEELSHPPYAQLSLLSDQGLLILIPQGGGKWVFKRLTAWDSGSPKEDSLEFKSTPARDGLSQYNDVMVNPASTYAVIRMRFADSSFPAKENRFAEIVLVDLRSFTIISHLNTSDPLLAQSSWAFAKNGMLIADAMTSNVTNPPNPKPSWAIDAVTYTVQSAALHLPELTPSMPCQYNLTFSYHHPSSHQYPRLTNVDGGCADLVKFAGVPTAEDLPDGPHRTIPYPPLAGPNCAFAEKSPSGKFALYGCRNGHNYFDYEINTTNSRSLTVLSVPDNQRILTVSLPHNMVPYPSHLAEAGGHTWLLVLRDGIKLETYRIP